VSRPSFRNTSRGGATRGASASSGAVWGSPFSHAQILHLMKSEFARSRRHGLPLTVVVCEVDRLRPLVDLHGAELREAVREALGKLMVEGTRSSDYVGTASDDRFMLLLPHTELDAALAVAERLRQRFSELDITVRGQALALSMSCGVTDNSDKETLFFDTMLSQAEVALDWARHARGNQAVAFSRERFAAEEGTEPDREDPPAAAAKEDA
jgi:diguanylate cyclase (GGDEF)-like protein